MKRILMGILVLGMVLALGVPAQAERIYTLNLSSGPMAPSGTSTFVVTPAYGGATGVTVIDRPYEKGEKWTLQVEAGGGVTESSKNTSGISPYTKGQTGVTDYQLLGYRISLYFSDFIDQAQTGGSVYTLPAVLMTGATPFMHSITVPPCKYMWGRVTETGGVSAFYRLPVRLFPANQGN